jgi:hypothetical protein
MSHLLQLDLQNGISLVPAGHREAVGPNPSGFVCRDNVVGNSGLTRSVKSEAQKARGLAIKETDLDGMAPKNAGFLLTCLNCRKNWDVKENGSQEGKIDLFIVDSRCL